MNTHPPNLQQRIFPFVAKFILTCIGFFLLTAINTLHAQATLISDQSDYPPGDTVILTGNGFQPGETVKLQVVHDNDTSDNGSSDAHEPWMVDADASGNFVTTWIVPADEDELNATLLATADGQSSALHAETTFTDANWNISPAYPNLCGGVQTELTFTITQVGNTSFLNGRFRIAFPAPGNIISASLVSVSNSKNWTISLAAGNSVCLSAVTAADALLNTEAITFKIVVIPPNVIGMALLNGVSAAFGAGCPTMGTPPLVLRVLAVSTLSPVFTQCPSDIALNTTEGSCNAIANYTAQVTGTDPVITYSFSGATSGSGSGTGSGSAFNKGTTVVTITASNSCSTKTCSFNVTVTDSEKPTIACPSNINLSACDSIATWSTPEANDNCPGITITQTGGPESGSVFGNGTTSDITYTATDASGNTTTCTFQVTRAPKLIVAVNNYNKQLYFGYSGDQTSTVTVTPSGGVGPYDIKIEMNRPLICNYINDAGDETWTSAASSFNNFCADNPAAPPYSTLTSGNSLSVKVALLDTAWLTTTITDQDGCTVQRIDTIYAEDVRCFAGKSGIAKVTICHRTGSAKNPCVTICVDEDAVNEHLAHGDFPGKCTVDCIPQVNSESYSSVSIPNTPEEKIFKAKIANNPNSGSGEFVLAVQSNSNGQLRIIVTNEYGIRVYSANGAVSQIYRFGSRFASGMYVVTVVQGKESARLKVIKEN